MSNAYDIRERLRNPPNAVPDPGIQLIKVHGVTGYQWKPPQPKPKPLPVAPAYLAVADFLEERLIKTEPAYMTVTVKRIQEEVCHAWKIRMIELLGPSRTMPLVQVRQIAMKLCKLLTGRSYPDIGRRFGNRDHTTVLHGIRKFKWLGDLLCAELSVEQPLSLWIERAKFYYENRQINGV